MRYLLFVHFFLANNAELLEHLQETVNSLFLRYAVFPDMLHKVTMEVSSSKGFPVVLHRLVRSRFSTALRFHGDYILEKVDEPLMTEHHQLVQFRRRIVMQEDVAIMEEVYHSFQVVAFANVAMHPDHLVDCFQIRELRAIDRLQPPQIFL